MEPEGTSGMKVCQTDAHGRITARDTYESVRNVVKCTGVERLCADGRGMVQFTAGETELINRLGGQGRQDTEANFEKAMHGADSYKKMIMERAVRKCRNFRTRALRSWMPLLKTGKYRSVIFRSGTGCLKSGSSGKKRKLQKEKKGEGGRKKAGWSCEQKEKWEQKNAERKSRDD